MSTYVFCNQCGHRNPPESNFCSSCGSPLDALDDRTITLAAVDPLRRLSWRYVGQSSAQTRAGAMPQTKSVTHKTVMVCRFMSSLWLFIIWRRQDLAGTLRGRHRREGQGRL